MQLISSSFRESVYDIIDALQKQGINKGVFEDSENKEKASIYGGDSCLEISPMTNIINVPLQMFPIIPGRGNHFTMQLAEIVWVLHGKTNIREFFGQFASPIVQQFSHNTDELYAAYGYRIRNQPEGNDVLAYVIKTLDKKITSRSAVVPLFNAELDTMGGEHKPCATTFQLHLYKDRIDGILTLRASDLIKGYSAINFLEFAFIQAIVAYCLNREVGRFINFTTTMHYYVGIAAARVEQIKKYRNLKTPPADIHISDMFDNKIGKEDRYQAILEDVDNIYKSLATDRKDQTSPRLTQPIFRHIFEILKAVKFNLPITETAKSLPDYFLYPYLENQYRDSKDEVEKIIESGDRIKNYKESITWRNNQ